MQLRTKVAVMVAPLVIALAVLTVLGMVSTRRIVSQLTEITEKAIPLGSVVSRITENQLEQAIWFERPLSYPQRGVYTDLDHALEEFERLNTTVADDLGRGIAITEEVLASTTRAAAREGFSQIRQSLLEISTQRAVYERSAHQMLFIMREGVQDNPTSDSGVRSLSEVRQLEDLIHDELESVRARFSLYTEEATAAVLRIERLVMVFMIVGVSIMLLIGLLAFPLLLLYWK